MKRGTQVYYLPTHANGDLKHPDVEQGFVTKAEPGWAFVRYFHKNNPSQLRTTTNGERTPVCALVVKNHRDQGEIDKLLEELGY